MTVLAPLGIEKFRALTAYALSMPVSAVLLLISGVGSIAFALVMQWGFNVPPCDLCIWQRYPFAVVGGLAFICLIWRPYNAQTTILLALCTLTFLVSTGLAILHSGVERHWWKSPTACVAEDIKGSTIEDIRLSLLKSTYPPCDEIPWSIFGLSLANLNIAGSFALALFAAGSTARHIRTKKQ